MRTPSIHVTKQYSSEARTGTGSSRRGFTLIELLVVIAIIAILAAILFPVFAKAREKGRQTACANNMRQIVLAFLMYADDNGGRLPPLWAYFYDNPPNSWTNWKPGAIVKYIPTHQITQCTSLTRDEKNAPPPWSYTINGYTTYCGATGSFQDGAPRIRSNTDGLPQAIFPNPSKTILLVDENKLFSDWYTIVNDPLFVNTDRTTNRHDGRANVVYLDGHVGQIPGMSEWNSATWPDGTFMFKGPALL